MEKTSSSSNVGIGLGCDIKGRNRVNPQFQIREEKLGGAEDKGALKEIRRSWIAYQLEFQIVDNVRST